MELLLQMLVPVVALTLAGACGDSSSEDSMPGDASEVPRISPQELNTGLENGEQIMIVDTRPTTSFEVSHIAGAVSIPANETIQRLSEFLHGRDIVFYCA